MLEPVFIIGTLGKAFLNTLLTLVVAGCGGGKALYIDSTSGIYATSAFTSSAVGGNLNSGNFTISFMAVADADMETNSSALNTGFKDLHSPFGSYATKSQFDIGNSDQIRFRSPSSNTGDPSALTQNTWHHIVATSNSGQDAVLYKDGVVVDSTNTGNFDATVLARFKSKKALDNFIKKIQTYDFVERTETRFVLNVIKEDLSKIKWFFYYFLINTKVFI